MGGIFLRKKPIFRVAKSVTKSRSCNLDKVGPAGRRVVILSLCRFDISTLRVQRRGKAGEMKGNSREKAGDNHGKGMKNAKKRREKLGIGREI